MTILKLPILFNDFNLIFQLCHLQIKTALFLIDFDFKSAHPRCLKTAMPGSPIFDNDNWTMEANRPLSR
jgi:hypothetical protein